MNARIQPIAAPDNRAIWGGVVNLCYIDLYDMHRLQISQYSSSGYISSILSACSELCHARIARSPQAVLPLS